MKIAIVGYGKMGRMIEQVAAARSHDVIARFDIDNNVRGDGLTAESLGGVDVALEFSTPDAVIHNIRRVIELGIPLVVGTTGWYEHLEHVKALVGERKGAMVYAANFAIGMNLFLKIADYAAGLFAGFEEFDPLIIEHHHRQKKDAPSGTALVLSPHLEAHYSGRTPVPVSVRAGYEPGTHIVGFDGEAETITLTHVARSRFGFAAGAVLAAERIAGKRGFYKFSELL
jgi:4-hydroxy-tetrahydrodipicolinate reductase